MKKLVHIGSLDIAHVRARVMVIEGGRIHAAAAKNRLYPSCIQEAGRVQGAALESHTTQTLLVLSVLQARALSEGTALFFKAVPR